MCQSHAKDKTAGAQIKPFCSAFTQVHFAVLESTLYWRHFVTLEPLVTITQTSFVGVRVSRWSRSVKLPEKTIEEYLPEKVLPGFSFS